MRRLDGSTRHAAPATEGVLGLIHVLVAIGVSAPLAAEALTGGQGFVFQVSPDGRLIDTAETTSTLRSLTVEDDAQTGLLPDRLFLFAAPQSRGDDDPLSDVTAAAVVTPRAVRASPEILHAIETTALRYGSHDALRQAGLSVTDWTLFYRVLISTQK